MSEHLWLALAATSSLVSMAWLALSMAVHWAQVMHRPPEAAVRTRQLLRLLGAAALPLSLLACLMADRPSMAALVWVLLITGSTLAVSMLLAHRPGFLATAWPWESRRSPPGAPTRP